MKIKTTRCWNCHVHTTHVDDGDNENIGCPNCGRMLYPSKPKPGVTRHSVALGYFEGYKPKSWTDAIVGDITSPKVLAEMLADAKAENAKSRSDKKTIGKFGSQMPNSTEICVYCENYYSRNLPGGWRESGCTKHGWKPDGQGGTGKRLSASYTECKGKDFKYIQRKRRLVPIPKPDWVK